VETAAALFEGQAKTRPFRFAPAWIATRLKKQIVRTSNQQKEKCREVQGFPASVTVERKKLDTYRVESEHR
jgi:hypothetical protein